MQLLLHSEPLSAVTAAAYIKVHFRHKCKGTRNRQVPTLLICRSLSRSMRSACFFLKDDSPHPDASIFPANSEICICGKYTTHLINSITGEIQHRTFTKNLAALVTSHVQLHADLRITGRHFQLQQYSLYVIYLGRKIKNLMKLLY
jgi:hypothetical protein